MSFEAVGIAIALSVYGTVKLTQFAAESVYRMRRRSAASKAAAARATHEAAEKRRHDEAMKELKEVEGSMARSTESLMKEMREVEKRMEMERRDAMRKLDAEWDASMKEIESKAAHAPEALLALTEFHRKRTAELTGSMAKATKEMELKMDKACREMSMRTEATLAAAGEEMARQIGDAELRAEEREARYASYARKTIAEAEALLSWVKAHYELEKFAFGELIETEGALASAKAALESGAAASASGNAAVLAGAVQHLQLQAERRTAAFARSKAMVAEAAAELMDQVEASRELVHEGDPEEMLALVTEETDADFWSEGRLKKLWARAEAAAKDAEELDVRDDADLLAIRIGEIQRELMSEYTRTRLMLMSRHEVLELARKVIAAYEENNWVMSRDPEYAGGDARRSLRLYFVQDGDERMVTIKSSYNPRTGLYEQQLVRHVEESGMPDESKRRADDEAINKTMTELGVRDAMQVTCKGETVGMRKSLSEAVDRQDSQDASARRTAT